MDIYIHALALLLLVAWHISVIRRVDRLYGFLAKLPVKQPAADLVAAKYFTWTISTILAVSIIGAILNV